MAHPHAKYPQVAGAGKEGQSAAQRSGGLLDPARGHRAAFGRGKIAASHLVETKLEMTAGVGEGGKLELVAVPHLALGADGGRHQLLGPIARDAADAAQLVHHVVAFCFNLLLVGKPHPRTPAAYPGVRAGGLLAQGRAFQNLHGARLDARARLLRHFGFDDVAGKGAGHEGDFARFGMCDCAGAMGQTAYGEGFHQGFDSFLC